MFNNGFLVVVVAYSCCNKSFNTGTAKTEVYTYVCAWVGKHHGCLDHV